MFVKEICNLPDEFVERMVRAEEQLKSLTKELRESKKLVAKLEKETADMRLVCGALKKIPGGLKGRFAALFAAVTFIAVTVDITVRVLGIDDDVRDKISEVITRPK